MPRRPRADRRVPLTGDPTIRPRPHALPALLLATALAAGCAAPAPPPAPAEAGPAPGAPAGEPRWRAVRVYIADTPSGGPRWHLDALLAERVFAPILRTWGGALVPWHFHRRAAADAEGHRFSFAFRTDPAVARQVLATVRASALLEALRRAGEVREVREDTVPREGPASGELAAVTDPAWPPAVQRAWPYFAMGASRNWLALVEQVSAGRAAGAPPEDDDLDALLTHYRGVNDDVSALWRDNAQHAWLHHLNALFGYQPVLIRELRLMQF